MAPANLGLVRSIRAAWDRGDFSSAEWAHPEIEFVLADGPAPGTWSGLDGMPEGMRDLLSAWERLHIEADDYRELDGEHVLVLVQGTPICSPAKRCRTRPSIRQGSAELDGARRAGGGRRFSRRIGGMSWRRLTRWRRSG